MSHDAPTVSVCIPTYNRADRLRATIDGVLSQSFTDFELIISDNASDDDTEAVVRAIADPRVRYLRQDRNVGLFANMTSCLHLGSGRYRVVLPDDDAMLEGNLEHKVRLLDEHPDVGLVHSGFRYLDAAVRPIGEVQNWARLTADTIESGESFIRRSIVHGGITCVPSVMLRSELVATERWDEADGPYADLALWLRVAGRSNVGFLVAGLSGYYVHAGSASSGFRTIEMTNGKARLTLQHARVIRQAHGNFVADPEQPLSPALRRELADSLQSSDRRLRLSIMVNRAVSPATLARAKRLARWGS